MGLGDISSDSAVLEAIRQCDSIGRDQFLEQYGFGRSREYLLEFEGRQYDSKAILGVAHGIEFPREGALRPEDFSGGIDTVVRKLKELGFKVVSARTGAVVR